jgi:hypothetical protein
MGFMELWGFDPEQVVSSGKLYDHAPVQEGIVYNIDEDDAVEIPDDASAQVTELGRIFDLD